MDTMTIYLPTERNTALPDGVEISCGKHGHTSLVRKVDMVIMTQDEYQVAIREAELKYYETYYNQGYVDAKEDK